jgi:integrase
LIHVHMNNASITITLTNAKFDELRHDPSPLPNALIEARAGLACAFSQSSRIEDGSEHKTHPQLLTRRPICNILRHTTNRYIGATIMAVRKRQWHTRVQVQALAKQLGTEDEAARHRLTRAMRTEVAKRSKEDVKLLEQYPPQEAWIVDYVDGAGRRHIQTFEKKKAADVYASKVKVDVNAGMHVALDNNRTMADVAQEWLKHVESEGRERATLRQYRQHVVHHIVPRIGGTRLAKFTLENSKRFRSDLLSGEKKLSPAMARKVWVSFKSMLKNARCSHLADNVRIGINKRNKPKLEVGRDIPTPAEVKRLIEAAAKKQRLCVLLKVAALAGLRASELRGLRWADVDLKTSELHVRQRADRFGTIGAPKTDSSRRTIPLGPDLVLALKQWRLACPKGEADLIFPTSKGNIDHHKNILRALGPIMRDAHVLAKSGKPKYGLHSLRHFFASWCINPKDRGGRELPPKVVQQWLGHSSITMTLDIYGHLFPSGTDRTEIAASERALLG